MVTNLTAVDNKTEFYEWSKNMVRANLVYLEEVKSISPDLQR